MTFDTLYSVPDDLKAFPQWLVWRYEDKDSPKPTKVPYSAHTGQHASVTDPSTWATFETVMQALASGFWAGAGFVFTSNDPFTGIDLDDPYETDAEGNFKRKDPQRIAEVQKRVYDKFDTYSEFSPSGRGLHLICRGRAESGRKRDAIEMYSEGRFFTMTGNVYRAAPVVERQELIGTLWQELGGGGNVEVYGGDLVERMTDDEIIAKGLAATNRDKFDKLLRGDWQNDYPSQSEADQALMNFLAFYTQNRTQIMRIFRQSGLGIRDKAKRTGYLNYTINRAFDRMLPPIDLDGFNNQLEEALQRAAEAPQHVNGQAQGNLAFLPSNVTAPGLYVPAQPVQPQPKHTQPAKRKETTAIPMPPGLLGDIANYIYRSAPRPVPEIALAGAIGLMGGICGRAYNVSNTGLNQYVLLLAPTGTGKEAMASGISRLMTYAQGGEWHDGNMPNTLPNLSEYVGPAEISSGQALLKCFGQARSFVSIVGEFGLALQRLAHPRASSSEIMLKRVLLDLYNKSGNGDILRPTIYADQSKNTDEVQSPAFTLLGESTPETYYANLDESLIADGLLPRLLVIEYNGPRPPMNVDHATVRPDPDVMQRFANLCHNASSLNAHNMARPVSYADQAAYDYLGPKQFVDRYADDQINERDQNEVGRQLWSRAHLKALKLSGLVAVGVDPDNPVITRDIAEWAFNIIRRDIEGVMLKFESGSVGRTSEETKQVADFIRVTLQYLKLPYEDLAKYRIERPMHKDHVVTLAYVQRRLTSLSAFRNDRIGATNAIKRTMQSLIDDGDIIEMGKADLASRYNKTGRAFVVSNPDRFLEK